MPSGSHATQNTATEAFWKDTPLEDIRKIIGCETQQQASQKIKPNTFYKAKLVEMKACKCRENLSHYDGRGNPLFEFEEFDESVFGAAVQNGKGPEYLKRLFWLWVFHEAL
ncbi:MAG: hypothetical protein SGILL_006159 [Bacillariaceae sp.]